MKSINSIIILCLLFMIDCLHSQPVSRSKPIIDSNAIINWPSLGPYAQITPDGQFIKYQLLNRAVGSKSLIVQSTNNSWKKEFPNTENGVFSKDSKLFIFSNNDTVYLLSPGTEHTDRIENIMTHDLAPFDICEWLTYSLKDLPQTLVVRNLLTGQEIVLDSVNNHWFDPRAKYLLVEKDLSRPGDTLRQLQLISLADKKSSTIWSTKENLSKVEDITFDKESEQIFIRIKKNATNYLWYYKKGTGHAQEITNVNSDNLTGWSLRKAEGLSKNGSYILLNLEKNADPVPPADPAAVKVDIYRYSDSILPYKQYDLKYKSQAAINTGNNKIVFVTNKDENILTRNNNYALVSTINTQIRSTWPWWPRLKDNTICLVSLKDGLRIPLNNSLNNFDFHASPDDRYFVYIDNESSGYYSLDLRSMKSQKISQSIPDSWFHFEDLENPISGRALGVSGWLPDQKAVLVYDQYDIWQLDLSGKSAPINITKGYGRRHHIKFRIIDDNAEKEYLPKEDVILTAFETTTKYNGFYHLQLGSPKEPDLLTMGPLTYYRAWTQKGHSYSFSDGMKPVKAADSNVWIVQRQSSISAPDFCITRDFKNFTVLTDIHPENQYNWLTTELVTYSQLDGTASQGVLYKPENFDPAKKYPLIFNYYEKLSHRLYEFPLPDFFADNINIPWFVSRGYLVFTPDFHYTLAVKSGKVVGDYAVNSVAGAINYLVKRSYIDAKRIGIQGHSFGGGETLFLITHSSLFAAACAAAPTVSDEIASTLGFDRAHPGDPMNGRFQHAEKGHDRIGASIWQRPDLYLRASPILQADKVSAPLLLMHNQGDESVDWNQGVMMFMALRRLQKPAWMLQYDNADHNLDGKNAIDYTIRMTQFFDYYLKDASPPKWMTDGIPRRLKGIVTGFELVPGKKP